MAPNNRERVGRGFDLLAEGLLDFVDPVMTQVFGGSDWDVRWAHADAEKRGRSTVQPLSKTDVQLLLRAITEYGYNFKDVLSRAHQGVASVLRETRNQWAHGSAFSSDDTAWALENMERLLRAVDAVDSAEDVRKIREVLQRTVYEAETRQEVKKTARVSLEGNDGLKPWREVIQPHDDVARGEFTASEFAADLHLVHTGQAVSDEYADPIEFFSRTYLTEGLRDLLSRAIRRLSGDANSSPVVNLQTNFGGGKTHSMLALYHLFSGTPTRNLPQEIAELVRDCGEVELEKLGVRRVALVGTYLKAGSPNIKEDGTEINTLWGELAWQLGGRKAYDLIAADDRAGTNPGETLRTLIQQHSPVLVLIDEWVAYARQLISDKELPGGAFDTQFTFAQSLTEIVSSIPGAMLVVSIPASDGGDTGSDIEVGGANGKLALERLQNVIRRKADQWRPSTKDESFEIVRRRLFQAPDADGLRIISGVARAFVNLYRNGEGAFPREASNPNDDYEKRIRASYPLHPELLDRLYEDWSSLERFQRTRGVLKLVSSIVHELWASNDSSPMIMPGTVPLDATSVNTDLTQYLEDSWKPIIDSDIDGADTTARKIDLDRPNLGKRYVTQRIARTIFMGAAPRARSTRKGIDKQYVWLGTAVPGDTLGNFGSALELLSERSTYFYEEQGQYWFDTQPSITKTATDYAEQLLDDPETVWNEIVRRLGDDRLRGKFDRVHTAPETSGDIPDLEEARLVIVHPRYSYAKGSGADDGTSMWVRDAVEKKGAGPRTHRNTLIFLVADKKEINGLEAATRTYLGWRKVEATADQLNLSVQQKKQCEDWVQRCHQIVESRLVDAYSWYACPQQLDPEQPFEIEFTRLKGSGIKALAERVTDRAVREEQLITQLGASILGGEVLHEKLRNLWERDGQVSVGELWGYFTRYIYMPRLARREVLDEVIQRSVDVEVLTAGERFAIARGRDEATGRYQGLILPPDTNASLQLPIPDSLLLVDYEWAEEQRKEERAEAARAAAEAAGSDGVAVDSKGANLDGNGGGIVAGGDPRVAGSSSAAGAAVGSVAGSGAAMNAVSAAAPARPTRFFGSVSIDPERYSRDIGNVTREVIERLVGSGAELEISIEIQATKPAGFTDQETRTIKENTQTLKFNPGTGFEDR